jgi:hypothetical protein
MTTEISLPTLASLNYYPYIDDHGELIADFQGKIGVYAIFKIKISNLLAIPVIFI